MSRSEFRVAVLASGAGTNLQAILDKVDGRDGVAVVGVASDKPAAQALERAQARGIDTAAFPAAGYQDRVARDAAIGDWLEERSVDLVVLAGYMQLLSAPFVERFRDRVINVHPALLPTFPGLDAIGQALEAEVAVTGVSVHYVDEGIDSGPVLVQRQVEIPAGRNREELEAAIHAVEHELLPQAVRTLARRAAGGAASEPTPRLGA